MPNQNLVISEMDKLLASWEVDNDNRRIFLGCYKMMTQNMLDALQANDFEDVSWVAALLDHFAEYYFSALHAYDQDKGNTPIVWKYAFEASHHTQTHVLQNLVLGVNAHINFDLVFAIYDLLLPEWGNLSEDQRQMRYRDHCHVNDIIYKTIDQVQDEIIDQYDPEFRLVDKILGPLDEWVTIWMVSDWREEVWEHAIHLIENPDKAEQLTYAQNLEDLSSTRAQSILGRKGFVGFADLI